MRKSILLLTAAILMYTNVSAQENLSYQKPSKPILELADFERAPIAVLDSKNEFMVLTYRNTYKTLDDLNQEEMRLGGLRINPKKNISSTLTYVNNIKVKRVLEQEPTQVKGLPENLQMAYYTYSPDEKKMAFTHTTKDGVELWVLDVEKATAKRLTKAILNANLGKPFVWFRDSERLLVNVLPSNRKPLIDANNAIPSGPIIAESDGTKAPNRTYQDLLKNPTDEVNFQNLVTSELHEIDLKGKAKTFKSADMYSDVTFSPDGSLILVHTLKKPFSYFVPYNRFAHQATVYSEKGDMVKVVNEVPLSEVLPKGFMSVRKGKRSLSWRNDEPNTLFFVEALDEGDANKKDIQFRDRLFLWKAPFDKEPTTLIDVPQRFSGITWGNKDLAVVYDNWYDTRNVRTYLINPAASNKVLTKIDDRNSQDVYAAIGDFATTRNEYGKSTLIQKDNQLFLIGEGYTKEGKFPFIDAFDIQTNKKKRLYQSTYTDKLESLYSFTNFEKGEILVQLQSSSEYPNYYIRNINSKEDLKQITFNKNPFQALEKVHKEVITYKRKDGVELSGTLYLPANYDKNAKTEKLPLLVWAYPREYKDANSAGQTTQSPNAFTFPSYGSFIYWVTKGYAVLDNAAFPIVGEKTTEPNDNFIEQLVWNAEAAIEAVDKLGYIDRTRVGVGGHSYGAFMTANLLTHSNLFACGIARSGAYNRTLTPFGFQSEQRSFWEATDVYNKMSPFMTANKMKTPMLLTHGEADNNPGTFTLQTERYFQALKGLGAPVRMVILPKEGHSYLAKDNVLHLLWEQEQFLDKYLKPNQK